MRNMLAPHRSQTTLSVSALAQSGGESAGLVRMGWARRFAGAGLAGSGIAGDYKPKSMDARVARERMVSEQIVARGVRDARVLAAMRDTPRERFVPPEERAHAYDDRPLPIGEGQTISQPYMVAAMTAALAPTDSDRALEIGTGSGYQAAILGRLCGTVISIERFSTLAARASEALRDVGAHNVSVIVGDGSLGYAPGAPYDRILVTAGAPSVPETLTAQLADGGRLVIPVGSAVLQQIRVIVRVGSALREAEGESCVFVPLVGKFGWPIR
jgi:protein-L-isoaspartate(D-aspartate) O-methyltransferase